MVMIFCMEGTPHPIGRMSRCQMHAPLHSSSPSLAADDNDDCTHHFLYVYFRPSAKSKAAFLQHTSCWGTEKGADRLLPAGCIPKGSSLISASINFKNYQLWLSSYTCFISSHPATFLAAAGTRSRAGRLSPQGGPHGGAGALRRCLPAQHRPLTERGGRAAAMAEEGAAKLRLKPRKAPAAYSREPSPGLEPPRRRQALVDRSSWFEKDDLNECEKTWILLLKNISQDLQCTSWQAVSSFPEFFGKVESSEKESLQKQEVFKIGMKDFEWISFPSFCKEEFLKTEDLSSPQLTESQIDCLREEQGQADELKSLPSTAEKTGCVTATDQAKNMVGEDTQGTSKMAVNLKSCKVTQHNTSTCHSTSQSAAKALNFQQHCRATVHNSKENRKQDKKEHQAQMHQSSISFGKAKTVPAEKKPPLVSTPGTESCEKTANQSEGSLTLNSCPMCQIQFSATMSQLDVDSHLARCLSESADDIVW